MVKCKDCVHHVEATHECDLLSERSVLGFPADAEVVCPKFEAKETE